MIELVLFLFISLYLFLGSLVYLYIFYFILFYLRNIGDLFLVKRMLEIYYKIIIFLLFVISCFYFFNFKGFCFVLRKNDGKKISLGFEKLFLLVNV